jgi:hypothetical protein
MSDWPYPPTNALLESQFSWVSRHAELGRQRIVPLKKLIRIGGKLDSQQR